LLTSRRLNSIRLSPSLIIISTQQSFLEAVFVRSGNTQHQQADQSNSTPNLSFSHLPAAAARLFFPFPNKIEYILYMLPTAHSMLRGILVLKANRRSWCRTWGNAMISVGRLGLRVRQSLIQTPRQFISGPRVIWEPGEGTRMAHIDFTLLMLLL